MQSTFSIFLTSRLGSMNPPKSSPISAPTNSSSQRVHQNTRSIQETANHFGWPLSLVKRALAYARAFPDEIQRCRQAETE